MDEIFLKHDTDKSSKHNYYTRQYEKLLSDYKDTEGLSILEIGVYKGGSLRAWKEYFPNASVVVGVDILEEYRNNYELVEIGNATDETFMKYVNEKHGPFDIIIDDGSHRNSDVIKTFEIMFPLLKNKGIYIAEDTVTFKYPEFMDRNFPNHLNYFVQFLPFLNQGRFGDYCVDPFKIDKKTNCVYEYSIDKMEFGCSYIAISKLVREHWVA